jgi:hypothetical protein
MAFMMVLYHSNYHFQYHFFTPALSKTRAKKGRAKCPPLLLEPSTYCELRATNRPVVVLVNIELLLVQRRIRLHDDGLLGELFHLGQ